MACRPTVNKRCRKSIVCLGPQVGDRRLFSFGRSCRRQKQETVGLTFDSSHREVTAASQQTSAPITLYSRHVGKFVKDSHLISYSNCIFIKESAIFKRKLMILAKAVVSGALFFIFMSRSYLVTFHNLFKNILWGHLKKITCLKVDEKNVNKKIKVHL